MRRIPRFAGLVLTLTVILFTCVAASRGIATSVPSNPAACLQYEDWYGTRGVYDLSRGLNIGASLTDPLARYANSSIYGTSPDGAFAAYRFLDDRDTFQVVIRPVGTPHLRSLSLVVGARQSAESAVHWAPDSRQVALTWRSPNRGWFLTVGNLSTGQITSLSLTLQRPEDWVELHGWSADSRYLALTMSTNTTLISPYVHPVTRRILVLDAVSGQIVYQTSAMDRLPSRGYERLWWGTSDTVQWSGNWLAYLRIGADHQTTLMLFSADDGRERVYALGHVQGTLPMLIWSPDGRYIAVATSSPLPDPSPRWRLDLVSIRGETLLDVSEGIANARTSERSTQPQLGWAADGSHLYLMQRTGSDSTDGLWMFDPAQGKMTLLQKAVQPPLQMTTPADFVVTRAILNGMPRLLAINTYDGRRFVVSLPMTALDHARLDNWAVLYSGQSQWMLITLDEQPVLALYTPNGLQRPLWQANSVLWSASRDLRYLLRLDDRLTSVSRLRVTDLLLNLEGWVKVPAPNQSRTMFFSPDAHWVGISGQGIYQSNGTPILSFTGANSMTNGFTFSDCIDALPWAYAGIP